MAVFSSRKGQALEALVNALGRCEREGIVVRRNSTFESDECTQIVVIQIPDAYWKDDDILLVEEIGSHPEV